MKVVNMGTQKHTKILVLDEPHPANGANHGYAIIDANDPLDHGPRFAAMAFQNGPVKEAGVNGCHNEDMLYIVLHRLEAFQAGKFACMENAMAIMKIKDALQWLNSRTRKRESRGVEGTNAL